MLSRLVRSLYLFSSARNSLKNKVLLNTGFNSTATMTTHCKTPFAGQVKGIIFDMDGTLTEPNSIDFNAMYVRNGLTKRANTDILTLIGNLPTFEERDAAMKIILEEEMLGCERMELRPNLHNLLEAINKANVRIALSTRNCEIAYQKFVLKANLQSCVFDPILHRDSLNGVNKPDPAVARHIMDSWNIKVGEERLVWFVGDSLDDVSCGRAAGCSTCLIRTGSNEYILRKHPELVDVVVDDLIEFGRHVNLPVGPAI